MRPGDGVRDMDRKRNERQAAARRRKRALVAAEERELEAARELQERLRMEFYSRNPHLKAAA